MGNCAGTNVNVGKKLNSRLTLKENKQNEQTKVVRFIEPQQIKTSAFRQSAVENKSTRHGKITLQEAKKKLQFMKQTLKEGDLDPPQFYIPKIHPISSRKHT